MEKEKFVFPELEISVKIKNRNAKKHKITSPDTAAELFAKLFNADTFDWTEEFLVLFLNRANVCIGIHKHSYGGTTGVLVDVKNLFVHALQVGAHGIIMAHNHPSGNLSPSAEDKHITKKVKQAGELLDITLIDHLILVRQNDDKYLSYSMMNEGEL